MKHTFRIVLILAALFIQASCTYKPPGQWVSKVDTEEVSRVVLTLSTEFKYEHHLFLEDAKVFYGDGIEKIKLCYITQDILEMCEARALLVDVVQGMLERLNDNPIVASQSTWMPLSSDQIEVSIICETFWGQYGDSKYINWILLQDGWAHYYDQDIQNHYLDLFYVRNEPYTKSLEFVTIQREAESAYKEAHSKPKRSFLEEITRDSPGPSGTAPSSISNNVYPDQKGLNSWNPS